jgi:DNA-binding response OmpR family regulator
MLGEIASPARLLLVEDEPANRALVRAIVARATARGLAEFDLVEAENLESARRLVASGPFKAILLDVRLPDGSGLDLVPELTDGADRPWVVVMSASVHIDEQVRARGAGADIFVGKPIETGDLLSILGRVASAGPS